MPPEQAQKPTPEGAAELKRIRTYQSDVEELMQTEQVSKAGIAIAESEKRIRQEREPRIEAPGAVPSRTKVLEISRTLPLGAKERWNARPIVYSAFGIVVLLTATAAGLIFWRNSRQPETTPPPSRAVSATTVFLQGGERRAGVIRAVRTAIEAVTVPKDDLRVIPIQSGGAPLTTAGLFSVLETKAPPALVRALGPIHILGVGGGTNPSPFLLFSVSSYDFAFAGMLQWEDSMIDDIGPLFAITEADIRKSASATTTAELTRTLVLKDVTIRNKDVRALVASSGEMVFLYSFIDRRTLVLAANEETLRVLLSRAGDGTLR